jgi:hypothetical protein
MDTGGSFTSPLAGEVAGEKPAGGGFRKVPRLQTVKRGEIAWQ